MNTKHELQDLLSLCKDDERFAIQQALNLVTKIRSHDNDPPGPDLDAMMKSYERLIEDGVPRRMWSDKMLNFEAYEINGNVQAGGGCFNPAGPIPLQEKDEWGGLADVYTVAGASNDDG